MDHFDLSRFRHHRHPSNASETSSSSQQHHLNQQQQQLSSSPAPSTFEEPSNSFVDEPLPMEGDFATLDLHSPPNILNSFLPSHSPNSQPFRYDTLTWAKDHPYPEPHDTLLPTTKSSIDNLAAMFDSSAQQQPTDSSEPPFQHTLHSPSPSFHQQIGPSDRLVDRSSSRDRSNHHPEPLSLTHHVSNDPQIPAITTSSLSSNPTSPLLRLNMNHPAMPNGPSISLTSATPLTAKPGEPLENFFESMGSLHSRSMTGHNPQTLGISQANELFQPLVTHPSQSPMQQASHQQMCPTQQNSFYNPRPVRARQRSKSESMGKQLSTFTGTDPMAKFFFANPANCAPPTTDFASTTNQWDPSSSTSSYYSSSSPQPSSHFWAPFQATQQAAPTSQVPLAQSSSNDGRSQLMQQFIDSSYLLGGLFEQLDQKKELENYDSSFLKPTAQVNHRRSHSVSHIHRRGRSEGGIPTGKLDNEPVFDSFLNMTSSTATSPCLVSSPGQMNSMISMGQNLVPTESNWSTSFPRDVGLDNHTMQHYTTAQAHSPVPSDTCLSSQYSSRARSFSHGSSFGSEETGGSGGPPSTSLVPPELRSRTTAATKAAAVKRRKAGVAARYVCDMCGETFTRRYNLRGHQRAHKGEKPFACGYPGCTSRFARAHDQKRHYKLHLGVKDYSCPVCKKTFIRLDALQRHHKSDAGQACYQQLEQTRIKSSTSAEEDNNNPSSLTNYNSNPNLALTSFSSSSRLSVQDDLNEDEAKPFLDPSSLLNLVVGPGTSGNSHSQIHHL